MSSIDIIRLQPEQWRDFKALRLEALLLEPQAFGSTYAQQVQHADSTWQERLERSQNSDDECLFFARSGNQLVGMAGWFRPPETARGMVVAMYVQAAARGQGVASQLLQAVLEDIRLNPKIQTVFLTVNVDQEPARRLYERFGFSVCNEVEIPIGNGQILPALEMEQPIIR